MIISMQKDPLCRLEAVVMRCDKIVATVSWRKRAKTYSSQGSAKKVGDSGDLFLWRGLVCAGHHDNTEVNVDVCVCVHVR